MLRRLQRALELFRNDLFATHTSTPCLHKPLQANVVKYSQNNHPDPYDMASSSIDRQNGYDNLIILTLLIIYDYR